MSLFPYPGGKTSLCRKIVDYLMRRLDPSIQEYREPFVGGGSVATHFMETHPEIRNVWLNDRDPGVASIWLATRDAAAQLGDLVFKFEPTVEAFSEYRQRLTGTISVPDEMAAVTQLALEKLALHRISYSSLATKAGGPRGGYTQTTNVKIDARWQPDKIAQRVGEVSELLASRNTRVTNQDFEEVIRDASRPAVLFSVTPLIGIRGTRSINTGSSTTITNGSPEPCARAPTNGCCRTMIARRCATSMGGRTSRRFLSAIRARIAGRRPSC